MWGICASLQSSQQSFPHSILRHRHIKVRRKLEGVTHQGMCQNKMNFVQIKHNSQLKKDRAKELASAFTQSLFTFLPQPPSPPPYWAAANFQNPHGYTVSDISYSLHTGALDMIQMLCSASQSKWSCTKHSTWQWFKAQHQLTDFFLFPQSHLPFPLLRCSSSSQQEDFQRPSHAASAFVFVAFCFHDMNGAH